MTSKLNMRAKKLQYNVKLRIYNAEEIVLEDQTAMRSMIHVSTGVEKDEEEEHHLQRFISASQLDGPKSAFYIPTPDASKEVAEYDELYKPNYVRPQKPIRIYTAIIDDLATTDSYDLDEEDTQWIRAYNAASKNRPLTEDQVEKVITRLEQLANERKLQEPDQALPNLSDLGPDAAITGEGASAIYDYWQKKRERLGRALMNLLKPETKPNDPDPYVCFRRRELRQTRKSRRNDQQSYEKLVKLRTELDRARTLVDLMRKRDRLKKEQLLLELLIFEQRVRIHTIELKHPELAVRPKKESIKIKLPVMPEHPQMRSGQALPTMERKQLPAVLPPPPEPEVFLDWNRTPPPDSIFRGMDLQFNMYNRLNDAPLHLARPDEHFIDLTHAQVWEPRDTRPVVRRFRQVLVNAHRLTAARLRMGRNGRLWIDRSSKRRGLLLTADAGERDGSATLDLQRRQGKRTFDVSDGDSDGESDGELDVPSGFMSMPLVLFTPQDLHGLNGGHETARLQKSRQLMRAGALHQSHMALHLPSKGDDAKLAVFAASGAQAAGAAGPPKKLIKLPNGAAAAALSTSPEKAKSSNKSGSGAGKGSSSHRASVR